MDRWAGVAMLIVTGVAIFFGWFWLWAGLTPRIRCVTLERLFPFASHPVAANIQQIIWPIIPILGLLWVAVGFLTGREIQGHEAIVETAVVIFLFALIALIAVWTVFVGSLPRWLYPGWRAERFYVTHPDRIRAELNERVAKHFMRSHRI